MFGKSIEKPMKKFDLKTEKAEKIIWNSHFDRSKFLLDKCKYQKINSK